MSTLADGPLVTADQVMRRLLHEVEGVRWYVERDAAQVRQLREGVQTQRAEAERTARARVGEFQPADLGGELREKLRGGWQAGDLPVPRTPEPPPTSFEAARDEWNATAGPLKEEVRKLVAAKWRWNSRFLKLRRSMPAIPPTLLHSTQRLTEIHAALPELRERYVADKMASLGHLDEELASEIESRKAALVRAFDNARAVVDDVELSLGPTAAGWAHPGWLEAAPAASLQRIIRLGQFEPRLPQSANIGPIPALLEFPFRAGLAIAADVAHRPTAVDLARAVVLRSLAAAPPGDLRFVFVDPVALGQSIADFRHLAEFDQRLVDVKTWTSERDIESRLEELSDHLEVVISNYLRGQFESIDDYNLQAGEVAEPYRILVIFDYPQGFTGRSARQLLSLIENGPRCGVHTVLLHDPTQPSREEMPVDRLTHSMYRIDLTGNRPRATLGEPVGQVDLDFLPDAAPPIAFEAEGRPATPFAQLLLNVGGASRQAHSGPVTLERVLPILGKLISTGRSDQVPQVADPSRRIEATDADSWWTATTASGACAPIGRAGASDLATLYFSSTEIAGGAIVVGLPRSGKSTALHAAILSLSIIYSPEELELYLVDSKHGVEFKVYERLPHARLVSINSERELSVAVLQSLDGEIRRRAELMKRRTAGKANITEYRAATGETLPRIVLFMDEFHEVFEEDDALGQAAFAAFSNIVRQGPFAGVHVVVASQTLSSMPAMDRGTLSLLPMRVAFMCNDADADLVMGDDNREVKALSQQGAGIFNPARGEPSHNKPFRGMYVAPDERDGLLDAISAKAAGIALGRMPRVFDGDTLAVRPANRPPGSATRAAFALGEPFDLEPWAELALRRGRGANVVLFGAIGEENADASVDGAVHSCLGDATASGMAVQVVDFMGQVETAGPDLDLMRACQALGVDYRRASALTEVLTGVESEVGSRRAAADYGRPGLLLVLYGLHRALELAPEDPYADPAAADQQDQARSLARVLRDGPEVGCHSIVVLDRLAQFERRLGRDMLKEFDWRVAGSGLSSSEVATITDSYGDGDIRHSQLLIVDHGQGRKRRVRGYPRYTAE